MVSRRHEWHKQKPKAPKVEIQHITSLKAFEHELTSIAADHHLHYSGHNAAR